MFYSTEIAITATALVVASFLLLWFIPRPNIRGDVVVLFAAALGLTLVLIFGSGIQSMGLRQPTSVLRTILEVLALVLTAIAAKVIVVDLVAVKFLGVTPQDFEPDEAVYRQPRLFAKNIWESWYAGTTEELLFRGFLQTSILQIAASVFSTDLATIVAVLLPALLFGVAHKSQGRAGVLTASTIGVCFGCWFAINGGDLLPLIIAHCTINSITYVVMFLVPPERYGDA